MEDEGLIFTALICIILIEIIVGFIQLIGALIRTVLKLNSGQPLGKLKIYWIIVIGYLIVFVILYYSLIYFQEKSFAYSYNRYNESAGEYDYSKDNTGTNYWNYLGYSFKATIIWASFAWLIAIWYCINIVFTKKTILKIKSKFLSK